MENIDISSEDVEAEISNLISTTGSESEASMRQALSTENAKESIRTSLMNRKIMARLVEIVQGEASASPASEETPAADGPADSPESNQETEPEEESTPAEKAAE